MTVIQSFKVYELLQSYSIDKDEAKLMISEIEQIVKPNENNDISIRRNELVSKKTDSLKLELERERKFGKNILWIVSTIIETILILLIIYKLFLIK